MKNGQESAYLARLSLPPPPLISSPTSPQRPHPTPPPCLSPLRPLLALISARRRHTLSSTTTTTSYQPLALAKNTDLSAPGIFSPPTTHMDPSLPVREIEQRANENP